MRALLLALLMALASFPALAVNPDEVLTDPALEARARSISANLRCLVCQNQSIDDSDADLARELRLIVRERLVAGDTDAAATQYIVDRYGEFVLLNPVFAPHTLLLWLAAPVVLIVGLVAVTLGIRRRRQVPVASPDAALSPAEQAVLEELEGSGKEK
jgi:cytochrome c-type biogenesis protein CcmH